MTQEEILDDIKVIIEAEYAKRAQSTGMRVPIPDETVPLLNVLSEKLETEEEKQFFWQTLQDALEKEPRPFFLPNQTQKIESLIYGAVDRLFIFFVKVGKAEIALNYFNLERNIDYYLRNVLKTVTDLLVNEPHHFDRNALTRLEGGLSKILLQISREEDYESKYSRYQIDKACESRIVAINGVTLAEPILPTPPPKPRPNYVQAQGVHITHCKILLKDLTEKIKIAKFNILKVSYQGINFEINQDKEELKLKIKEFKFNPELNECLDKFEVDYQKADKFDLKSCIGHIRTFTEKLVISVAQAIAKKTNVIPTSSIESMGTARQYLRDGRVDFLSQKQDDFLGSFYALASDEQIGAHSLTSDREHARIIKNEGIEVGLFLVKLLDKKIKNPVLNN